MALVWPRPLGPMGLLPAVSSRMLVITSLRPDVPVTICSAHAPHSDREAAEFWRALKRHCTGAYLAAKTLMAASSTSRPRRRSCGPSLLLCQTCDAASRCCKSASLPVAAF